MPSQKFQVQFLGRSLLRPLVAALAAAAGSGAWADEPSPWYVGARETFTHDSNVFRTPDGVGDSYSSTSLLGGFSQTIGRQRVYAAANVAYNKYRDQDTLNNTSYGVNAGWDWATIEKLSGSFTANANQSLASYGGNTTRPSNTRNIVNADQIGSSVRWGGEGRLTFDANYTHSRVRYSSADSLPGRSTSDSASLGTFYGVGPDLKIGAALRFSRTNAPYAVALTATPTGPADYRDNRSNSRNVDLLADWKPSSQTGVNARLSWTRLTNSEIGGRDFSGLTGSLSTSYTPTAKLGFSASLARDAGSNSSYFTYNVLPTTGPTTVLITSVSGLSESSQITDSLSLGATYAATAKINVNAGLQYRRAKLVDSLTVGAGTMNDERTDTFRTALLGVSWDVTRNWQLGCTLSRESRTLEGTAGFSYNANIAACSAQITLR